MRKVILPGSYDPITLGHLEVVKRAAREYGEVYVVAFINPDKKYLFSAEERVKMLSLATEGLDNVKVDFYGGYVVDYMREKGIDLIVKGYRNETDYEYELRQAEYNKAHGGYDTVLWLCEDGFKEISSTKAREIITAGENMGEILPQKVISYINSLNSH